MNLQKLFVSLVLIFVVLATALVSYGSIAVMSQRLSTRSDGIMLASGGFQIGNQ